jgi:hypothetical protein
MIKYVSTIKEWRDRINGNTYFSAQIEDVKNGKKQYLQFQYGYGSHAEYTCKELLGLKGFNSKGMLKNGGLLNMGTLVFLLFLMFCLGIVYPLLNLIFKWE